MSSITKRFLKYVNISTDSNENNLQCPSSIEQWDLAKLLVEELKEIGMTNVKIDENCYVTATLNSNSKKCIPTVGFIAHMDTAPNYSGKNIKPRIVYNYDGGTIILNEKENIELSPKDFPELVNYKGQDLIVTDGTTLLGADDKAGIAAIIEAMKYLNEHKEIEHGTIKVCFTPDEEVGRGADLFDVESFGCDFAYTIDGGEIGELEFENFNAASAIVEIKGRDIHPGYAKNAMINSILLGMEFQSLLPVEQRPEYTQGYEGFFLLDQVHGTVENTRLEYIIRDHSMEKFNEKKNLMENCVKFMREKHKKAEFQLKIVDSYNNMREKIEPVMYIVDLVEKSMKEIGIEPKIKAIRGGTDGARLSFKGLPCPNIFAGGHNFHGKYEYVPIQSMEMCSKLIVKICENLPKIEMK